jgi:hypothetical protein
VETCGFTGHHKVGFNVTRADIAAFTAAHELASVVAEKVHNPNLTGPARALSIAHITTSKPAWQMRPLKATSSGSRLPTSSPAEQFPYRLPCESR